MINMIMTSVIATAEPNGQFLDCRNKSTNAFPIKKILLMGEFLIPAFLGGGKIFFIGNALVDLFLQSRNWPFGSAVAITLVFIMLVTVTLYMRLTMGRTTGRDESLM